MKKKFIELSEKFNGRAHARQELIKMQESGLITDWKISWNTQLKMMVQVVYSKCGFCGEYERCNTKVYPEGCLHKSSPQNI